MAVTQLSDVFIPQVYSTLAAINSPEKTAFVTSGVVATSPLLDEFARGAGKFTDLPFWKDLDASREPNASNDDPADRASPAKVVQGDQVARRHFENMGWSSADLVVELNGSDPMQHVKNRTGSYWSKQMQRKLIASCMGVLADNVANDGGDMQFVSNAGYSRAAFIGAAMTLGDAFEGVGTIAVHSFTYQQMLNNDDIAFIKDSTGTLDLPTFLGKRVILDDSMPLTNSSGTITATSVLFGAGAFGWGQGSPAVPVEMWRDPQGGNGGGIEQLWERKTWVLHPFGFKWSDADVTNRANTNGRTGANTAVDEYSPLNADLAKAANWDRVVDRKSVPLAFLKTVTAP